MKKIFCLNYFCLVLVFLSIIFLAGCGSTPESTLQEFKKAIDSKNGNKIWSLLSSKDHKIYNSEYMALDKKNSNKQNFMMFVEMLDDLPNAGKPLEIESVTEKSKNKVVIFVKNNPSGFTLVKEYGVWKVSMLGEDGCPTTTICDCFTTPEDILWILKKAVDSKDGHKILRFLSSKDETYYIKYYNEIFDKEKLNLSKNSDNAKNKRVIGKEVIKKMDEALFAKIMKDISYLPDLGKELKIKNLTKKSEDKVLVFIEDNQEPFTFVKESVIETIIAVAIITAVTRFKSTPFSEIGLLNAIDFLKRNTKRAAKRNIAILP